MSTPALEAQVAQVLSAHLAENSKIGVAVSGGSDSMALMHLAASWARQTGVSVAIATVDHALRPETANEVQTVADAAARLGLPHQTLKWSDWDGTGNLQDRARDARQGLLADWASTLGLEAVLLGHTRDDQAETFLMRLARGSGIDGLAAMAPVRRAHGAIWIRPLLEIPRSTLQAWLTAHGHGWVDDPSNDDLRFDRVRFRKAADDLAALGLDAARLTATAAAMSRGKAALQARAYASAQHVAEVQHGILRFDLDGLADLEDETRFRLLARGLQWTASHPYRPRFASLTRSWEHARAGQATTLHGCQILTRDRYVYVAREIAAISPAEVPGGSLWDGRWHIDMPGRAVTIAALGKAGAPALGDVSSDLPRAALLSLPALWENGLPIAIPALSWGLSAQVYSSPDLTSFLSGLIPH